MLDSGVHPGLSGMNSLPFFDEYDLSKVDILLISHFHLDHAASLPYVMQQTSFKGRVFMTHATKAIYRWLLSDFVRVTSMAGGGDEARQMDSSQHNGGGSANLYTNEDLMSSFEKIETIDYHSTIEVEGIRFTAYHAGHVLGACMYFLEIGGVKILFTGDYSREEDRHLKVAEVPPQRPDILITESTFGTATHEPRLEKETRMMKNIHSTILKGGRVLMPVFALGRAQELLLILEEYWSMNEDIQSVNIYYASDLARKCMAVYQTYTSIMNEKIRLSASASAKSNPFQFKFIKSIRSIDKVYDMGPCVVVASPGMLQSGVSRQLLERWAPDPKNAVIMTGYAVEGTMAKEILTEPHAIPSISNPDISIPRRLSVDEISFAAHVDFQQNAGFIEEVAPKKIILVHGDSNPMGRLKSALLSRYSSRKGTEEEVRVFNPRNCEDLQIGITSAKIAKVVGSLAEAESRLIKDFMSKELKKSKIEEIHDEEEIKDERNDVKMNENPADQLQAEVSTKATNGKKTDEKVEDKLINSGIIVSGVLISKDFDLNLLQLDDIHEFTQLTTSVVKSNIKLKIESSVSLISWHLEQMFGYINVINDSEDIWECLIMDMIYITADKSKESKGLEITVEWINNNAMADSLADSVVAILYNVDSSPASVKLTSKAHSHGHVKEEPSEETVQEQEVKKAHGNHDVETRIRRISTLLKAQFGDSISQIDSDGATIKIGKAEAQVDFKTLGVVCPSRVLKDRVESIIKRGCKLAAPLAHQPKTV
ncbi:Metallo-hydrolase/oxidoreductase [Metschnikowia bicuspidata var. bicuspidata NRRL YB-4993]|uniref:Endoribonuclease YSH1 n=1 Tax=Metschnikowia bicuspidata var. bicuspidata NRRL YB-4993 TaxID=869754 RepID=A0A1A0GZ85_9ASCO|nr:Metallo-hydrolase/oxidoreductase [Metschnikowia bicuspidata var. bicuspidata NRRL YB-4993]OBA17038.1 Metallo-hydrolase/oxidoreductase [Metschnikowia bicuspidata var. bicuspidata NRRL YB-4993]